MADNDKNDKLIDGKVYEDMDNQNGENESDVVEIRRANVDYSINLPDSEAEIMLAIWRGEAPLTTEAIMNLLVEGKTWKRPTLISFLARLEERGFVMSYKKGRERYYVPLADKSIYINRLTVDFVKRYHDSSFVKFLDSMYSGKDFTDEEIDELIAWLKTK